MRSIDFLKGDYRVLRSTFQGQVRYCWWKEFVRLLMCQIVMVRTLSGGEPGGLLREPEICARAVRGWIQKPAA